MTCLMSVLFFPPLSCTAAGSLSLAPGSDTLLELLCSTAAAADSVVEEEEGAGRSRSWGGIQHCCN